MDWFDETIQIFDEYESPARFTYWSLLAAVSALVRDEIYLDRFRYKLYCNIYVLLYGPSGIKKGPPISLAKEIVNTLKVTRVINGRSSVEGIMKELGTAKTLGPGKIITKSCAFIVSSELSSGLVGAPYSLDVLTDLFDRIFNTGEWDYNLKNSEKIRLKDPTITWLSGTNEALFREFIPEKNLKGGLIGRTFLISETKENRINSLMYRPKIVPNTKDIAEKIKHVAELQGPFFIADSVRDEFDAWYQKFKKDVSPSLEDDTGTVSRIDDNILKLAMLISCARRADMIINIDDIEEAMKEVLALIVPTRKVTSNAKQNDISSVEKTAVILKYLANIKDFRESRVSLIRKFILKMDHEDLDRAIQTLEHAKAVRSVRIGSEIWYELCVEREDIREYIKEHQK